MDTKTTRRAVLGSAAGIAALAAGARAQTAPTLPSSPVSLNIVDVGGQLQLTQRAFEAYRDANPKLVSRMSFTQAPAPELPGKLQAQQRAGRVDIDMVLGGTDIVSAGIEQKLWVPLLTGHTSSLPDLNKILEPQVLPMQALAQGQAVCVVFCPGGPLLEYMEDRLPKPPGTTDELLAYTRAQKNRFFYARPANSGPGRAFMMGLPYLLGDKDPKDPDKGWDKTWAYMAELGKNIDYYPTGTVATLKELGEGSRDMIASHVGWDINPRVLGVVPASAKIATLKGFHFVTDAQYIAVPKGGSADKLAVVLDVLRYMLTPKAQAFTWDKGYFYPGPAVRNVPLSLAPADSQAAIKEFGRGGFYPSLFASTPMEVPLDADKMVFAFSKWDQLIGAKAGKG